MLAASGWARSVGGSGPYLTLFARAGLSREAIRTARLPFRAGVEGGSSFGGGEMKTAAKLGVSDVEIQKLCETLIAALKKVRSIPIN